MDDDGFTVHQRRRRVATREPGRDSFLGEGLSYSGTDEAFEKNHAELYGREEGLGPDGKHRHGERRFPRGSDRERLHTQYSASTQSRNDSGDAYQSGVYAANRELRNMSRQEQKYYETQTGGFAPRQHERLENRARNWSDVSLENAEGRRRMLKEHPYGYHSATEQNKHHEWAEKAYAEYDFAKERRQHHETYRSHPNYPRDLGRR